MHLFLVVVLFFLLWCLKDCWLLHCKSGIVPSTTMSELPLVKLFWVYSGIKEYRLQTNWSFQRVCYFSCTSQHCVKLVLIFSVSNSLFTSAEEGRWYLRYHYLILNVHAYIFYSFHCPNRDISTFAFYIHL